MSDNEMRHPIDTTWIERTYPDALHPPDAARMKECPCAESNYFADNLDGKIGLHSRNNEATLRSND